MSVIWQGPICEELHGMAENGSAETMTDEGGRNQAPDSRVSYNGVVDHRKLPVPFPLCSCVDRCRS